MTNLARLLVAAAAIGGLAAPAAAQYQYPQQSYPQYQQGYPVQTAPYPGQAYGYGQQGYGQNQSPVQQIIDSLLGNRYNVTDRQAVSQCAAAAVAQAQSQYRGNGYGYGQGQGYGQGYNPNYNRGYGQMRVTAITDVQRRTSGLRVKGLISTGYGAYRGNGQNGYQNGYQGGYQNGGYAAGDLSFRCNVDYRGAVTNIRLDRNSAYRNY